MEVSVMAKFAELDSNNVVIRVLAVDNSIIKNNEGVEVEQLGIDFLKSLYGQETIWKQTSINTFGGVYYTPNTNINGIPHTPDPDQTKAIRKNYANIGYIYDPDRDAFRNPKPVVGPENEQYVTFDETACLWKYNPPSI
jgi:hypothetical protein